MKESFSNDEAEEDIDEELKKMLLIPYQRNNRLAKKLNVVRNEQDNDYYAIIQAMRMGQVGGRKTMDGYPNKGGRAN